MQDTKKESENKTNKQEEQPENIYIRVGTQYYKKVKIPLASKDHHEAIIKWKYETLKQDYGMKVFDKIPKYNGFCVIPDHLNYKQEIDNFYNRYLPINHKPKPGSYDNIQSFLKHVFKESLEMGLDYIQLLYTNPVHKLPILALVSQETNTGKSTFLNFLKMIFGGNMTINNNEDFRSQFNSDWADKLIIGIDETFLDKKEDSERIKNLSTSKVYKKEAKGQDRREIEFFAKFILCSNNEDDFIKINPEETRYWVIKVNPIKNPDDGILDKMEKEIPAFLHQLKIRNLSTQKESRMWFNLKSLRTEALKKLIKNNRSKVETELYFILLWIFDNQETDQINCCVFDVKEWFKNKRIGSISSREIRKVLQSKWKLEPQGNSYSYTAYFFSNDGEIKERKNRGRYYTVTKDFLEKLDI